MKLGKRKIKNLFATVSGVGTTTSDIIDLWAKKIPQLGIITTKSISKYPCEGYEEPILCEVDKKTFRNAVGLPNPGCKAFAKELKEIYPLRNGTFLLTSIYGKTPKEFQDAAKVLAPYSDGLELNFSCPHAKKGYGSFIGSSEKLTYDFTKAVKKVVKIPVVVKLTPNVDDIGKIAIAAEKAGADAISAVNTYKPEIGLNKNTGFSILDHGIGGMSGKGIKDVGLKCVKEISDAVNIPILGMGGVSSIFDVYDYLRAGASWVGIGSALAGMDTSTVIKYFEELDNDLIYHRSYAYARTLDGLIMEYESFRIMKVEQVDKDLKIFYFDKGLESLPGQFVFTWLPGHHEKPFSIANDNPLTLAVRKIGHHTSRLFDYKKNDSVFIRGPYGNSVKIHQNADVFLVGGGTGAAPLHFLANKLNNPIVFLGGKNKNQLLFEKEFKQLGKLVVATDDGSKGYKGFVTGALENYLLRHNVKDVFFFNCGPETMMKKAFEIEKNYTHVQNIYSSLERYCSCGVGLCGKCAIDGKRMCVDGPVFDGFELSNSKDFGVRKRDKSGKRIKI